MEKPKFTHKELECIWEALSDLGSLREALDESAFRKVDAYLKEKEFMDGDAKK